MLNHDEAKLYGIEKLISLTQEMATFCEQAKTITEKQNSLVGEKPEIQILAEDYERTT